MTSKVNYKKRAESKKEVFILLSLILLFGILVGVITTIRPSQVEKMVEVNGRTLAEIVEAEPSVFLSTSPTDTTLLTPTPTPFPEPSSTTTVLITPTPQTFQIEEQIEQVIEQVASVSYYQGPPLPAADEKKELLIISDSLPQESWRVERGEFEWVTGKLGRGLRIPTGGGLLFSGSDFYSASGTLSFWLKLGYGQANGEIPLIDWNFNGNSYHPSLFEISYDMGVLLFNIYDQTYNQIDIWAPLENPQEWHRVKVTWDVTNSPYKRFLYIDDVKVAEGDIPLAPQDFVPSFFQIGGTLGGRDSLEFYVDEVTLTNWVNID